MSLGENISALCEEVMRSQNDRSQSIIRTQEDVTRAKEDTQRMMSNLHGEKMKAAEEMRKFLHSENKKMVKDTRDLLTKFMEEQNQIRNEISEASSIWRNFAIGRKSATSFVPAIPPAEKPKNRLRRRKSKK